MKKDVKRKISTEGQKMYVNAILPKKVMDHRCKKSSMTTGLQDLLLPSDPVIPNSADVGVFSVANCILLDFW